MKYRLLVFLTSLVGIGLSIYQYIFNRSLWLDEAKLAHNIVDRDYLELLEPMDSNQVAPFLFLWIERFFCQVFGINEFSLRLLPLIAFFCSIFLVFKVSKLLIKNSTISWLVLVLFCLSPLLIYYATEVKQYMLDVFVTLLLYYLFLRSYTSNFYKLVTLIIAGVICVFLSNISIIILFTLSVYFVLFEYKNNKIALIPIPFWILAFVLYYFQFIFNHPVRNAMQEYWNFAFLPKNPFSVEFWFWIAKKTRMVFVYLLNFPDKFNFFVIPLLLYVFGLVRYVYKQDFKVVFALIFPVLVHLALSYLEIYPFHVRMILYQIPLYLIPIAISLSFSYDKLTRYVKSKWFLVIVCFCLPMLLFVQAFVKQYPFQIEEVRPLYAYIKEHAELEDTIYVYCGSVDAFLYYSKTNYANFDNDVVFGESFRNNFEDHKTQLDTLKGRVWIIVSHDYYNKEINNMSEANFILNYLKSKGKILNSSIAKGSSIYLLSI